MGDGRAEGSSAIGDGGQAASSLMPDIVGMHVHIFESSQLESSYVGDLLYRSFASLGWFIPRYFILFVAVVNGSVSLISLSFHC